MDGKGIEEIEKNISKNLYKIWNRMSSGSYHPKAVRRVEIPKEGGKLSPLLANLYLHYAFDKWMERENPEVQFERYADDIVIHAQSQEEAEKLKARLETRLEECKLQLNPDKTCVVYCKDEKRLEEHAKISFTFFRKSRVMREYQARFCEKLKVKFLRVIRLKASWQGLTSISKEI